MNKKTSIIKKYWQDTPQYFSEKYESNFIQMLSPVNMFLAARRKKAHELAGNIKGKKILDAGCGSGIFMIDFIKKGAFVVGIDYSQKMLDLARKELTAHKIPKNKYVLKLADATSLPFKDNEFDLILATGLTDYLTDQQDEKFVEEASRVLKKNGSLIISFSVKNSPFSFARSGLGLKIRQRIFKLPPIQNEFTLEKLRIFLQKYGLADKKHHKIFATMWLVLAQFNKK